jgi:hypothetical protein
MMNGSRSSQQSSSSWGSNGSLDDLTVEVDVVRTRRRWQWIGARPASGKLAFYMCLPFSHARKRAMMLLPSPPAALQIGEPKPLQVFIGRDHGATRGMYTPRGS